MIALGLASDQSLLQQIANATGGTYFFSPDELGLFEIYNVARGQMADDDIVLNDTISFPAGDAAYWARPLARSVVIDCDVDYADFSIAAHHDNVRLQADLRCLSVPSADVNRLERKTGPGYIVMRLKRPQPGIYELNVTAFSSGPVTCSVAAYVKSPLRLRLGKATGRLTPGHPIDLDFSVLEHGRPIHALSVSAEVFSPAASIQSLARQWKKAMRLPERQTADPVSEELARALAVREHLRVTTGRDPFEYIRKSAHLVHPQLVHAPSGSIAIRAPTSQTFAGSYNVRFVVQGRTRSGCDFVRVGFRSVRAG
jgi:hypothetical protein